MERCVNCNGMIADGEVAIETPQGLRHERHCVTEDNKAGSFRDDDK